MITKPMLASAIEDLSKLKYPVLCTPKLDGIRCLKIKGKAVSRNFKPIPNKYIRKLIEDNLPDNVDGELIVPGSFQDVTSAVMTEDGQPDFKYAIFDYVKKSIKIPYTERIQDLLTMYENEEFLYRDDCRWINLVDPVDPIQEEKYLLIQEESMLNLGFEGLMIRSPDGPYKCGRSTVREGYLLKLKRFSDSEAEIISFDERLHNDNEATTDELGRTKRSSHQENMIPANTLGKLNVRDIKTGVEFGIGTGFDDKLRKEIWNNQKDWLGKIVKYKYQKVGQKDKPRFPVFLGVRNVQDMD